MCFTYIFLNTTPTQHSTTQHHPWDSLTFANVDLPHKPSRAPFSHFIVETHCRHRERNIACSWYVDPPHKTSTAPRIVVALFSEHRLVLVYASPSLQLLWCLFSDEAIRRSQPWCMQHTIDAVYTTGVALYKTSNTKRGSTLLLLLLLLLLVSPRLEQKALERKFGVELHGTNRNNHLVNTPSTNEPTR